MAVNPLSLDNFLVPDFLHDFEIMHFEVTFMRLHIISVNPVASYKESKDVQKQKK